MKKIIAIGGAVIKTAKEELRKVIEDNQVEMLIHNGGSIFHDFQQEIDENLEGHSYPIDDLTQDFSCNKPASDLVWKWVHDDTEYAPNSITELCYLKKIETLLFTGHACDFWQMFGDSEHWAELGRFTYFNFKDLVERFKTPFHYICMGSAVIHPEVFIKAIAEAKSKDFTADVVDFLDMYRPRTRVAKFGKYYQMTHKEFLTKCLQ